MLTTRILLYFSAVSFVFFGISCLVDRRMVLEFQRYGLDKERPLVGVLQIAGALSLFVGDWLDLHMLKVSASLGLCVLMLLGFAVRIKIKDSALQSLPSLFFALLNGYLLLRFIGLL